MICCNYTNSVSRINWFILQIKRLKNIMFIVQKKHTFICLKKTYFLLHNKNILFDCDDELKIGGARYNYMVITMIKVQLFWRLPNEM